MRIQNCQHRARRLLGTTMLVLFCLTGCSQAPGSTLPPDPTATSVPTATTIPTTAPTLTPLPTLTPAPTTIPLTATITSPGTARQGSTLILSVETNKPAEVEGRLGENTLSFWSEDGLRHRALAGVSAIADVGSLSLQIMAQDQDGLKLELESVVEVIGGSYDNEYLVFDDETAALLDPAYTLPEAEQLREVYGTVSDQALWNDTFDWPVPETTPITSFFGTRRWYGDAFYSYHAGTDLGAPSGSPVLACADGIVLLAETLYVRGNAVIIDHGQGVLTGYYHMSELSVEPGQQVQAGDQLGLVGTTGLSTGAHLHWELQVGGVPVNALEWTQNAF